MNRAQLSAYINSAIYLVILAVGVITPLLFLNFTTEFFEMPKMIFLVSSVLLLVFLWSLSWVISGRVLITRTPLDLALLLFLIVLLASTFFSQTRYIAILGNFPRLHGSAVSWVSYILLFFIVASNIKSYIQVKFVYFGLLISGILVSLVSLMSYFGAYLPLNFARAMSFTPTGSSFSTASFLVLLLPVLLISIINTKKLISNTIAIPLTALFGLVITLTGDIASQTGEAAVIIIAVLASKQSLVKRAFPLLLIPVAVSLLILMISFIPLGKKGNLLSQKRVDFEQFKEIQLPFSTSWKVSSRAFSDAPFLGTGPSTYLFNFTAYKPPEFNLNKNWNIRFDTPFNEYLQVFGTMGLLGIGAFAFFSILVLNLAWISLSQKEQQDQDSGLTAGLSISLIVAFIIMALHITSITFIVTAFLLLALLMVMHKFVTGKVKDLTIGIKAQSVSGSNMITGDVLPVIFFIPVVILVIVAFWYESNVVTGDYNHRMALNQANTNAINTLNSLVAAEKYSPFIDMYRTDLATTNFAIANAIAQRKGPSEASPGGSLTDADKQTIQQLLSNSVAEGRNAVLLSPRNSANWEVLGSIYRQITGVAQNALQFSLDAYGRAIQTDPMNPALRLSVGGIYYSVKNYDLAIRFFTDAANLKPDYANAYYNLSVALRDKGDLQNAELVAEQVVSLLQTAPDSTDYKTASVYLADLKARIATGSAQTSSQVPPAAQENGALQNKNLPKLPVDLQEKENVATPPAAAKNPNAKVPANSPSPSANP